MAEPTIQHWEQKQQPEYLLAAMERHGVTIKAEFVPLSQSRNKDEKDERGNRRYSLNWRVTLQHKGRDIITTDYSAGEGHCPSYKQGAFRSVDYDAAIKFECETGKAARSLATLARSMAGKAIEPGPADVVHSLLLDASAIDEGTFEDWASSLGYDTDSRKAEAMWRECIDTGLKLRAALGNDALQDLREAAEDF